MQGMLLQVYARYAPYQFLAYWHELWSSYEACFGSFITLPADKYSIFTGSNMRKALAGQLEADGAPVPADSVTPASKAPGKRKASPIVVQLKQGKRQEQVQEQEQEQEQEPGQEHCQPEKSQPASQPAAPESDQRVCLTTSTLRQQLRRSKRIAEQGASTSGS
jgi:hypothetical protein